MLLKVGLLLRSKRTGMIGLIVRKKDNGFGHAAHWDVLRGDGRVIRVSSHGVHRNWIEVIG